MARRREGYNNQSDKDQPMDPLGLEADNEAQGINSVSIPKPLAPVLPGLPPRDDASSRQSPRERDSIRQGSGTTPYGPPAGPGASPSMPKSPSPQAGSVQSIPPIPPAGVVPFKPIPSGGPMATPSVSRRQSPMFGAMGGLQEGGLGMALDPVNDAQSDPISTLIKLLTQGR